MQFLTKDSFIHMPKWYRAVGHWWNIIIVHLVGGNGIIWKMFYVEKTRHGALCNIEIVLSHSICYSCKVKWLVKPYTYVTVAWIFSFSIFPSLFFSANWELRTVQHLVVLSGGLAHMHVLLFTFFFETSSSTQSNRGVHIRSSAILSDEHRL